MCEGKGERRVWLNINCFQKKTSSVLPKGKQVQTEYRMHRRVLSIALNDERQIMLIQTRSSLAITVVV